MKSIITINKKFWNREEYKVLTNWSELKILWEKLWELIITSINNNILCEKKEKDQVR